MTLLAKGLTTIEGETVGVEKHPTGLLTDEDVCPLETLEVIPHGFAYVSLVAIRHGRIYMSMIQRSCQYLDGGHEANRKRPTYNQRVTLQHTRSHTKGRGFAIRQSPGEALGSLCISGLTPMRKALRTATRTRG